MGDDDKGLFYTFRLGGSGDITEALKFILGDSLRLGFFPLGELILVWICGDETSNMRKTVIKIIDLSTKWNLNFKAM